MKKKIIVANWKAYIVSQEKIKEYLAAVSRNFHKGRVHKKADIVLCVPFPYLRSLQASDRSGMYLGAQDVFWEAQGPYTGEVTAPMLKDMGVSYVIVGHSERRKFLSESDDMVSKKVHAALSANLKAVLCVGEWIRATEDEEEKKNLDFIKNQLKKALAEVKTTQMKNVVVTYEPVWAISGNMGSADTPENASRMVMFIRRVISKLYDEKIARSVRVMYGGSVSSQNAASFTKADTVDGVLVGSASTNPKEFLKIVAKVTQRT